MNEPTQITDTKKRCAAGCAQVRTNGLSPRDAGTTQEMYRRAQFAKDLGSVINMVDLVVGCTGIQSLSHRCRQNDMILHLHRAGHGTCTRQRRKKALQS